MLKVFCNLCGKGIIVDNTEEMKYIQNFNILVKNTNSQVSFDLCGDCSDKVLYSLLPKFKYPPDVIEICEDDDENCIS